jgi:hypothetical protein
MGRHHARALRMLSRAWSLAIDRAAKPIVLAIGYFNNVDGDA